MRATRTTRVIGRRAAIAGAVGLAAALGLGGAAAAAAGSDPVAPPPSADEVEATQRALDARAAAVPPSVVSWGVDPAVGLVVVEVTGGRDATVEGFLAGLDPRTYRVRTDGVPARPLPGS